MARGFAALVLAGMVLAGAAGTALADGAVITGKVVYLERMLLPEGAEARVVLENVSKADAATELLAEVTVPASTSPTAFTLNYPGDALVDGQSYALRATISVAGELLFATTENYPFDPAQSEVELLVRRVAGPAEASLVGSWLAEDIGGGGVIDDLQTTLVVAADGTVTGKGGCNGYGGNATITGDSISFGELVSTQMACARGDHEPGERFSRRAEQDRLVPLRCRREAVSARCGRR